MKLYIDGSAHTGTYRCDCECGTNWTGQGEQQGQAGWQPALPIAECVVHHQMCHKGTLITVDWSPRFRDWLMRYWEHANLRLAAANHQSGFTCQPAHQPAKASQ